MTTRLKRERAFHDDRFTDEHRQAAGKYYAVDSGRSRYEALLNDLVHPGVSLLEYGCGKGSRAFDLAERGARVHGIDISEVGLSRARRVALERQLPIAFAQMDAETLGYSDACFDVVGGSGILHHLDLDRSLEEIHRVLRPGGTAVFYEPLGTNPVINLYRRLTPSMRTPDEHPLLPGDFASMRRRFGEVSVEYHNLLSIAGVLLRRIPGVGDAVVRFLHRADSALFRRVPFARRMAWVAVIQLRR